MKIYLKTDIYPLEAVIHACYEYLDQAYFILDGDPAKKIELNFELKSPAKDHSLKEKKLSAELMNRVLYYALRRKISENNRKITESIVNRAIYSSIAPDLAGESSVTHKTRGKNKKESFDDPLGIAVPWEEKYGKKK